MIGGGRTARLDHRDRKRIVVIDIGFCWGAPVLVMALRKLPVVPSSMIIEKSTQTTSFKVTDTISSNTLAALQQPTFRFLELSLFTSHLYSYPSEAPCTLVDVFSIYSQRPPLIFCQGSHYTTLSTRVVPYQAFSRSPALPCRPTSTNVSWQCLWHSWCGAQC